MEILVEYGAVFITIAVIFGFFMTWGIGANDVANAMGTSVGSGAITVKQAIIIAAIFEFSGAFLAGGHVTKTIRKGIIDPTSIVNHPEILVYGMLRPWSCSCYNPILDYEEKTTPGTAVSANSRYKLNQDQLLFSPNLHQ